MKKFIAKMRWIRDVALLLLTTSAFFISANVPVILQQPHDPLLAIVIMVKNEAAVIRETLQPYVDAGIQHYLVFDTGSTDDTVSITQQYFEEKKIVHGVIKQESFVDFAISRNRALKLAEHAFPKACFFLMPDAEWYMDNVAGLIKYCKEHQHDQGEMYSIRLVTPSQAYFFQHRLIRAFSHAHFEYPVHEYTVGALGGDLPCDINFAFKPTTRGVEKSHDRLHRDIALLLKKYNENNQEERAAFYLGQSYSELNDFPNALMWYQRRTEMHGLEEETYVAQYRVGMMYEWMGEWEKALAAYHKAFSRRPTRIEPLIRMAWHYWQTEELNLCYLYARRALEIPLPEHDFCFVEKEFYDFTRYNLVSISAWYAGAFEIGRQATLKALQHSPEKGHLHYNLSLYDKVCSSEVVEQPFMVTLDKKPDTFVSTQKKVKKIEEKPIVIISVGYNNKHYYKRNLDSTLHQNYKNYRIIYVDADSPDGTAALVAAYLKEKNMSHKVTLIKNDVRCGSCENIYNAIQMCKPEEIIVMVEADDELAHSNVLKTVNRVYQDPHVWMTYGDYDQLLPTIGKCSYQIPDHVIKANAFRDYPWSSSHLRTYYGWLAQQIKREDCMHNGAFYPYVSDLVIMFPLLEMAGEHSRFIPEILYIWNNETPLNEGKVNEHETHRYANIIRNAKRYQPLDKSLLG